MSIKFAPPQSPKLAAIDPDAIPVGYIQLELSGKLAAVNRAFAQFLGVTPDILQGRDLFSLTHSADDTATLRAILSALALHPMAHAPFEIQLQSADSTTVTLSFRNTGGKATTPGNVKPDNANPGNSGQDHNTPLEFWVQDTSHNAQALDKSRVTRQRYDMALQATSDGLFDWDLTTDTLWTSRRFRQLLGMADQEISNDAEWFIRRVHEEDKEIAKAFIESEAVSDQTIAAEIRLATKPGHYQWFQIRAVTQRHDNGQLARLVGALTDNDDLRRSVDALAESASMNQAILNNVFDALITIDAVGNILLVNPATEKMFGYSVAEMVGQNVSMLMPSSDAVRHDSYIDNYKRTGRANIIGIGREVMARRKDGHHFPINLGISEVMMEGQRLFIGTVRDLTESRRADATLRHAQKMEALGQLTGGVAHDFNNLLTVVLGNLEMLEEDLEDGENLEILREAIEGATSGADLTRRLLAFSRKQPSSPSIVSLNETVDRLLPMLRRAIREHINIHLDCAIELPDCFADSSQLDNSLLNLVLNARDAMPDGGNITITTRLATISGPDLVTRPGLSEGDYVLLAVRDNGSGIPTVFHDRIFEPFFTSKAGEKGSGLGLSMVYGFVQQTGGHIEFSSSTEADTHGTEFRIFLPVTDEQANNTHSASNSASLVKGNGEIVLIVEDHPKLRQTACRMIRDLGYQVLDVADEESAIQHLQQKTINLVFTDMVLIGGGSGRGIVDRVKKDWPDIAVVMTSGYTEDEAWSVKPEKGIPFLHKPWRKQDLADSFALALKNKRPKDIDC